MKHKIPHVLIVTRLLLGITVLLLCWALPTVSSGWLIVLLIVGLLTDIFDGMIARRLQVSTPSLRRLDSTVDQVFFLSIAFATYLHCTAFFTQHAFWVIALLAVEALAYLLCFIKFGKEVATHTIGAKIWTLLLFALLVQLLLQCQSGWLFAAVIALGIATRIEIVLIILTLKTWTNDVPSLYHAWLLRQGKNIKRHGWFNG